MEKTWKANERAIARRLGGSRRGATGKSGPDIITDWLSVEVKTRRKLPDWIVDALEQARADSPDTLLPIVILHQLGQRHANDLVLLKFKDFEEWFGAIANLAALENKLKEDADG